MCDIPITTGARSLSRNYVYAPTRVEHGLFTWLFRPFSGPLPTFSLLRAPVRLRRTLPFHWHTTRLSTTHFFHTSPNSGPFSPNSALRYSHQSRSSISYDVTAPTSHTKRSSSYSQLQDGGLHTTRCSVLPTLRNTIYQSIRRHLATNFPILFSKNLIFNIFWGPFPGPQGILPLIFEFPYSRYISPNFSQHST